MIQATRLDRTSVVINALLIATVESTPDTIITLTTNRKIVVRESPDEVIERTVQYLCRLNGIPTPMLHVIDDAAEATSS